MYIPTLFTLWHNPSPFQASDYTACLVSAARTEKGSWKFRIMTNPTGLVGHCVPIYSVQDEWLEDKKHEIRVDRMSKKRAPDGSLEGIVETTHTTTIYYQNYYIVLSPIQKIPVFRMTSPHDCLGGRFSKLKEPEQGWVRFEMRPNLPIKLLSEMLGSVAVAAVAAAAPTAAAALPQHIVNGFLDSLFAKKEVCPISGEELERNSTCLTPCGHAISTFAAEGWIPTHSTCPICRKACTMAALQSYK